MSEKKSLLGEINAKEELENPNSPFKKKETTKAIRIRKSYYDEMRQIAFDKDKKIVDIAEEIFKRGLKNYKRSNK